MAARPVGNPNYSTQWGDHHIQLDPDQRLRVYEQAKCASKYAIRCGQRRSDDAVDLGNCTGLLPVDGDRRASYPDAARGVPDVVFAQDKPGGMFGRDLFGKYGTYFRGDYCPGNEVRMVLMMADRCAVGIDLCLDRGEFQGIHDEGISIHH